MNKKYPQNFKEGIVLGMVNCFVMVCCMMSFNLFRNNALTLEHFLLGFLPIFVFAFLLSEIFVGPIVQWIVEKFSVHKYMSLIRVAFMAGIMTFAAPIIEAGYVMPLGQYIPTIIINYCIALPLQVFVAMRLALFVLAKYRLIK